MTLHLLKQNTLLMGTAVALCCIPFSQSLAGPGKINGPHVTKGEIEIESIGTYAFNTDSDDDAFENEFEFEYGLTDNILIEASIEFENENGESTVTEGIGFGVRYELAEPGVLLVDTAVEVGYEFSGTGGADEAEVELLLQKNWQDYKFRSNVELAHEVGEESEDGLELSLAFGGYTHVSGFDVGVEYFADIGNLTEQSGYSAQGHSIGPIVGKDFHLPGGHHGELKLGYFQGISDSAADGTFKYELEFEF